MRLFSSMKVFAAVCCLLGPLWAGAALSEDGAGEAGGTLVVPEGAINSLEPRFVRDGVLDLDALVDHFEDLYQADSSTAEMELTITKPRRTRTMRMKAWSRGDEKTLIVVEAPAREKGTATLKVDKNLWNYLPRIKRTIRIPPSMMLSSWMGSDFTNDDLVRKSSFKEDYAYELVGPSQDPPGWIVRFVAKPGVVGLWQRFEVTMSEDGLVPLRAHYYDRKGRLSRTMHWDDVKDFNGRLIPAHLTMIPMDKEGHKTEMTYLSLDFDAEVPESMFSLSRLEQNRRPWRTGGPRSE